MGIFLDVSPPAFPPFFSLSFPSSSCLEGGWWNNDDNNEKKKEVEKGEVWLSEVEILNLGGDLRRGGGFARQKGRGMGVEGGLWGRGGGPAGCSPHPPSIRRLSHILRRFY